MKQNGSVLRVEFIALSPKIKKWKDLIIKTWQHILKLYNKKNSNHIQEEQMGGNKLRADINKK